MTMTMAMMTPLLPQISKAWEVAVPYQREDALFAARRKRVVLGHKTGLGKTFISLLAWSQWPDINKVLILGTTPSVGTWKRIIAQWGGGETTIMQGSGDPAWNDVVKKGHPGIWLCTYATFRLLIKSLPMGKHLPIDLFICDELHKALRNRTQTWKDCKRVDSKYFIGATATWASKGPQDLFPVLNMIDHRTHSSYWKFVETWCLVNDGSFGKEIIGVKNASNLKQMLRREYYATRTWKEVGVQFLGKEMATEPIVRRTEYIDMSSEHNALYYTMQNSMEVHYKGDFILAQNSLSKLTLCLQLALSPQLLFPKAPVGSAVEWLCERLMELESAVVFIPYKGLAGITAKYLHSLGYGKEIYSLYGGVSVDDCNATITEWKQRKGVVFCTVAYAQSFALDASDYAFFLGFDWDPNNNIQAEGRMRRFDSDFSVPCLATYIVVVNTVYEAVKDVINGKIDNVRKVLAGYGL